MKSPAGEDRDPTGTMLRFCSARSDPRDARRHRGRAVPRVGRGPRHCSEGARPSWTAARKSPTSLSADMSDSFRGRARIFDTNGMLVDVGKADLHRLDAESGATWGGTIRLFVNAALATKTMPAIVELENGNQVRALVGPQVGELVEGELVDVHVTPLESKVPF